MALSYSRSTCVIYITSDWCNIHHAKQVLYIMSNWCCRTSCQAGIAKMVLLYYTSWQTDVITSYQIGCTTSQIKPVSSWYQQTEFTASIPSGQTVVAEQVKSNQCHHVINRLNSPHQFHQVRLLLHHKSNQTNVIILSTDWIYHIHSIRSGCCCTTSQIKPVSSSYQQTEFTTSIPSGQAVVAHKSNQTNVIMLSSDWIHHINSIRSGCYQINSKFDHFIDSSAEWACLLCLHPCK